jgi:hypothetical protein
MDKQTELMLKYGPKDTCWAATYRRRDEHLLRKYFVKSATLGTQNNPMVIEFFDQLERAYNDHVGILRINSKSFEIIQIAKTEDIVTIQGLQLCCKYIVNLASTLFRYHGVGNSTIEPRAYQQRLYGETEPRADMSVGAQGSYSRVNQSMRFVGIFPISFPTITVRESAVFTNNTAYTGTMLNRQMFSGIPITHTVNVAPFTVATDINFTPVTTWG